jgi:hypothetical protein
MKFKIEATFTADGKAFVVGKPSGDASFTVSSSSRLDGMPLMERLEIPCELRRPELENMIGLVLADPAASSRFHKYDVVEFVAMMSSPNQPAAGNAGTTPRLAIEYHWPGVPKPGRWAA